MSRFQYLTFDCYGTLIDWKSGIESALESIGLEPKGRHLMAAYLQAEKEEEGTYKKYREVLERTAERVASRFGVDLRTGEARRFAASVPDWPAFPDTSAALKELGERGYSRYILSNVDTDLLQKTIAKSRLEVDGFVTAEQTGSYKPSPGHWVEFMRRTKAKKGEILHVAQSVYHDIEPTRALGISSAWVNRYSEPSPSRGLPLYVVESVGELTRLLE